MLNLLRLRETADYANNPELAPESPVSGRAAFQKYIDHTLPFLTASSGELLLLGNGGPFFIGPTDEQWDVVMLVKQSSLDSFMAFASNSEYLAGIGHRTAAVLDSRLLPIVECQNGDITSAPVDPQPAGESVSAETVSFRLLGMFSAAARQTMTDSQSRFLCTSYVGEQPLGPLSINAIENGNVRVVTVLYDTENIRAQLHAGTPLDGVVASLKAIQHSETSFPIAQLKQVVWNDFLSDVVFTYDAGSRTKRTTSQIVSADHRNSLLLAIQDATGKHLDCSDELASVLAVAWSRILGAVMAIAGTVVVTTLWDPARIGRVRFGQIALLLGREGCAVVGAVIFAGCSVSAWRAIRKRSRYYTYTIGEQGG